MEDILRHIINYVSNNVLTSGARPLYLLSTLIVMMLFYLYWRWRCEKGHIGLRDAFSFLFPKRVFLHRSAIIDYQYMLIEPIIRRFLFNPALQIPVSVIVFTQVQSFLVLSFGSTKYQLGLYDEYPQIFIIFFVTISLLLRDLGYYCQHYLMHKVPFLWEFHKTHHSAQTLTPLTEFRLHPLDTLSVPYITGIFLGTVQASLDYFLSSQLPAMTVAGMNTFMYIIFLTIHNLKHSHLWVSLGWHANHILASPIHHQIHHSKLKRHHDKNLGSNFAIWDWVFGTLYIPREREELEFGLSNDEDDEYTSVWHLLMLPFIKNYQAGRLLPTILLIIVLIAFIVWPWVLLYLRFS